MRSFLFQIIANNAGLQQTWTKNGENLEKREANSGTSNFLQFDEPYQPFSDF